MDWLERNQGLLFYTVVFGLGIISFGGITWKWWPVWETRDTLHQYLESLTFAWVLITGLGLFIKEAPLMFAEAYLKRRKEEGKNELQEAAKHALEAAFPNKEDRDKAIKALEDARRST